MLGHDLEIACTKCHENRRKTCATDLPNNMNNCVLDYSQIYVLCLYLRHYLNSEIVQTLY